MLVSQHLSDRTHTQVGEKPLGSRELQHRHRVEVKFQPPRCGALKKDKKSIHSSTTLMVTSKETLTRICSQFEAPIKYCFGYGSGVFSQGSSSNAKPRQIDMVFGVDNAAKWHAENLEQNPHHYSGLKYLGSDVVGLVQNKIGAGVYYNPFVRFGINDVKYGVVELNTLRRDLTQWETLYLAGRMQKPVRIVKDEPSISSAQQQNLKAAMSTALLLLPSNFSEQELYMKIAAVSYMGDVRMAFAENPLKVQNIVTNQFDMFRRLYLPLMEELEVRSLSSTAIDPINDKVGPLSKGLPLSQPERHHKKLVMHLPKRFGAMVAKKKSGEVRQLRVSNAVARIIKWPSFTQSLKGILTAGINRSVVYSLAKLRKRFSPS